MRALRGSLDFAVVLVFVTIGRAHHNDGETTRGIFTTTWPFAVGLILAWLFLIKTKRGGWTYKAAVLVASVTTAVGMILRVICRSRNSDVVHYRRIFFPALWNARLATDRETFRKASR